MPSNPFRREPPRPRSVPFVGGNRGRPGDPITDKSTITTRGRAIPVATGLPDPPPPYTVDEVLQLALGGPSAVRELAEGVQARDQTMAERDAVVARYAELKRLNADTEASIRAGKGVPDDARAEYDEAQYMRWLKDRYNTAIPSVPQSLTKYVKAAGLDQATIETWVCKLHDAGELRAVLELAVSPGWLNLQGGDTEWAHTIKELRRYGYDPAKDGDEAEYSGGLDAAADLLEAVATYNSTSRALQNTATEKARVVI